MFDIQLHRITALEDSVKQLAAENVELKERWEKALSEAREENATLREDKARLVEALTRVRTHGIGGSDCYDYLEAQAMANWIDDGCVGPLPEIVSPFVRAAIDAARKAER